MGRGAEDPRPVAVDLYCKAGGVSMGYHRAGFRVIGIDLDPQPRYPFPFIRADVLSLTAASLRGLGAAVVTASPPCKVATDLKAFSAPHHENLIPQTRELLQAWGGPYVIENVPGAPLADPAVYCGSAFRLGVERHRLFEYGGGLTIVSPGCRHEVWDEPGWPRWPVKRYHSGRPVVTMSPVIGVYGRGQGLGAGEVELWKRAMGIDWMTRDEMAQAIPPAYAEHIAGQVLDQLQEMAA